MSNNINIFSCACLPSLSYSRKSLCIFHVFLESFFCYSLHILNASSLSDTWFANIFSQCVACLFILLTESFCRANVWFLMKSNLSVFLLGILIGIALNLYISLSRTDFLFFFRTDFLIMLKLSIYEHGMVCHSIYLGLWFLSPTFYSFQHINTYVLVTLHLNFFSDYKYILNFSLD